MIGLGGEVYYTTDHYMTFTPLHLDEQATFIACSCQRVASLGEEVVIAREPEVTWVSVDKRDSHSP